jgi:hypothetical protein
VTAKAGTIDFNRCRSCRTTTLHAMIIALGIVGLPGCATVPRHQFAEPGRDWQVRSGQLMYVTPQTTLIGEVVVRFSKAGDFELTFSKGPGVTLLTLRQDDFFAEVKGAVARQGWSGPVDHAPAQLRGWLKLRDQIIHSHGRQTIRHVSDAETFVLRF